MTPEPPAEFTLLAACCRWPRTPESIDAIGKGAQAQIDWRYFGQLVGYHRVAGLVHDGLQIAGVSPPADAAKILATRALAVARTSLLLADESARLQRLFDQAGISALFLKGAALGQRVYTSIGLKHSWDIDLYVAEADVEAAVGLLESSGYALAEELKSLAAQQLRYLVRYVKELPVRRGDSGVIVEINWRASDNRMLFSGLTAPFQGQEIALPGGRFIRTLNDEALLIYLCVHGAGHAWNRLKWLADLHALLAQFDPAELPRLFKLARRYGSDICFGQGLLLCERIFGYRLPESLAAELHGSSRLTYLTHVAIRKLTAPGHANLQFSRIYAGAPARPYSVLLGRGWPFFREQYRIVSVQGLDVVTFRLSPRLQFLYPFLRVPFYLWRRLGPFSGNRV